ncbi:hypothetical protein CRG98_007285 [Punica granatum]|uniref:SUF system FeS cluster assembly SufBD core domain-containing protein n=1 Tax=Punica granatum TaxID=22663 RepID=A0A2I0KV13_PUNGR|nr:hypothetical protein CRG98_007285 [Punica granatum]
MASLLTNGISGFTAQPHSDPPEPNGFLPKFESSKLSSPKSLNRSIKKQHQRQQQFKARAHMIAEFEEEPDWMLEFRLKAFDTFMTMKEPNWTACPHIDFQDIRYYSTLKKKPTLHSLDEADPELLKYFDRLGMPLHERDRLANVAVDDAVLHSFSIATTHREKLRETGVIFCSILEAIGEYPDLVRGYLGKVVPIGDNYYAALNSKGPFGNGGAYNFDTKRGHCAGASSRISWTKVERGSAITWKYPSVVLEGDDTVGEFYPVALTNNHQRADSDTRIKMIHKGEKTRSKEQDYLKGYFSRKLEELLQGACSGPERRECSELFSV